MYTNIHIRIYDVQETGLHHKHMYTYVHACPYYMRVHAYIQDIHQIGLRAIALAYALERPLHESTYIHTTHTHT